MLKAFVAHCVDDIREVSTKYGDRYVAEIRLLHGKKKEFWLSVKQGRKLSGCVEILSWHGGFSSKRAELHIILQETPKGDRFVWCGTHSGKNSDLEFLEKNFDVECHSPYVGRLETPTGEPDIWLVDNESLIDEDA